MKHQRLIIARSLLLAAIALPAITCGQSAAPEADGILIQPIPGHKDYPVTPVPFTSVHVQDEFWFPRMETNRKVTVKADFKKCEETGRIDNFAKAGGLMTGEFKGMVYDDSDVFKVIEGASYTLAIHPDPELETYLDGVIAKIASAQEPDGYLYAARKLIAPDKMPAQSGKERWTHEKDSHELYNVGHLYEAAVAHFQATGKKTLLDAATKNADLICKEFTPGKHQNPPGHEEIEIGLCKLYRTTGERKYLDLAKFLIDVRGRPETHPLYGTHYQDHKPVVEQDEAVGHAVRAAYLYSGMADVAALTGDEAYLKAIDRIWENVVFKKLYLTGGIGASHGGEAFGKNYELPNKSAYNETCAAIANALWNYRMFLLHGDARYLDVFVNLFIGGTGEVRLGQQVVKITQQTKYPWDGRITMAIAPDAPGEFALNVRIPGWAQGRPVPGDLYTYMDQPLDPVALKVNGKDEAGNAITKPACMLAIPYYAWCNRGPNEMNVWLARTADKAQPVSANTTTK